MTTPTDIDRDAPVVADHEIDITAPLDAVWTLHTRVNAWPSWNQEMTDARLDGPFEAGNSFTWTSNGFTVTSTIYEVADHGRTLGAERPRASQASTTGASRPPPRVST